MYHIWKAFADDPGEKLRRYKAQLHSVTVPTNDLVTLCPAFFRDELELGMSIIGIESGSDYHEMMALDTLVINPLLDLLRLYKQADPIGARIAVDEMTEVLMRVGKTYNDVFPDSTIALFKEILDE